MEFQIERAEQLLRAGHERPAGRRPQDAAPRAGDGGDLSHLLDEIKRDGCQVLNQRTSLTPIRKLWIAWRTWIKG
jgi:phytoene synthase